MQLFHTSSKEITEIHQYGLFGEFLFFSSNIYSMCIGEYITYEIDLDEDELIEAWELFYHENSELLDDVTDEVMELASCDRDTAEELLSERVRIEDLGTVDVEDMAEASFEMQRLTAVAARTLGYRAVAVTDEQGTAYMIAMHGREQDLTKYEDE